MEPTIKLRISVLALFIDQDDVLLIHQMDPPEPDCWDLPGGGLDPAEALLDGLRREVQEETGITTFQVDKLLTVIENFFPRSSGGLLHTIGIIYTCSVPFRPSELSSLDPEIGPKGIQWLPIPALHPKDCSTRSWKALQAAGLVNLR